MRLVILICAVVTLAPASVSAAEPYRIMPLGDSITQGNTAHDSYRRSLWHMLNDAGYSVDFVGSQTQNFGGPNPNPDFDLDHEGHWGWRAQLVEANVAAWAAATEPDAVLMHVGTNDALQNESTESTMAELEGIIDLLQAQNPDVTIFFALLLPGTHVANPDLNTNLGAINALIPVLAAEKTTADSMVTVIDMNTGFDTGTMTYDGLHPNETGEAFMAQRWFAGLNTVLQVKQAPAGMPCGPVVVPALVVLLAGLGAVLCREKDARS